MTVSNRLVKRFLFLLAATVLLILPLALASPTCLDESGKPVDWWFIYKQPNGFNFAYLDSNTKSTAPLTIHANLLNRTETGALGSTLHQVYENKQGLAYILYNDEAPYPVKNEDEVIKVTNGGAHAKGIWAADAKTGFWLIHSVPKFPDLRPPTFTWNASTIYAQSFLCISFNKPEGELVANHLQYIWPSIWESNVPAALASVYPSFTNLVKGVRQNGAHVLTFKSWKNTTFTVFGKDNKWGEDLYEDLVAPNLQVGFQWQTWRRDNPDNHMGSYCVPKYPFNSLNILSMNFSPAFSFSYTKDHSKWGISQLKNWVCVGDINRMISQRKRGGGTACMQSAPLWNALKQVVGGTEACA